MQDFNSHTKSIIMKFHSKTFIRFLYLATLSGVLFTSSSFTNDPVPKKDLKGTIHVSGTRFLFPLIQKWADEFKKENPGVDFVISQGLPSVDINATAAPVKTQDPAKGSY